MSRLNNLTIILLICHFLGDFQFQFEKLAENKDKDIKYLFIHILIHGILLLFPFFIILSNSGKSFAFGIYFIILISHFLVDLLKVKLNKKLRKRETLLFILDQVIHILSQVLNIV